jgi:hypothetical protein
MSLEGCLRNIRLNTTSGTYGIKTSPKTSPFQGFTIVVMTFSTGLHPVLTNVGLSGPLVILLGVVEGVEKCWFSAELWKT